MSEPIGLRCNSTYRFTCEKDFFGYTDRWFLTGRFIRMYVDEDGVERMQIDESHTGVDIRLCISTIKAVT